MKWLLVLIVCSLLGFGVYKLADTSKKEMATCRDGTISYSKTRQGTCSRHGGVREWR